MWPERSGSPAGDVPAVSWLETYAPNLLSRFTELREEHPALRVMAVNTEQSLRESPPHVLLMVTLPMTDEAARSVGHNGTDFLLVEVDVHKHCLIPKVHSTCPERGVLGRSKEERVDHLVRMVGSLLDGRCHRPHRRPGVSFGSQAAL